LFQGRETSRRDRPDRTSRPLRGPPPFLAGRAPLGRRRTRPGSCSHRAGRGGGAALGVEERLEARRPRRGVLLPADDT